MEKIIAPLTEGFSDSIRLTEVLVATLAIGLATSLTKVFRAYVRHKPINVVLADENKEVA